MSVPLTVIRLPESLNHRALAELNQALTAAPDDGVIVLRAVEGSKVFCLGMDFSESNQTDERLLAGLRAFAGILHWLRESPLVSIAAVAGAAIGGGLGLAAACDVVVATDQACFGLPEALYGFSPAIVSVVLRDRLTLQAARLLALRCETIDAATAERVGLVDVLTDGAGFERVLRYEARRLGRAQLAGRQAVKHRFSFEPDLGQELEEATRLTYSRLTDPEVRERLQLMAAGELF